MTFDRSRREALKLAASVASLVPTAALLPFPAFAARSEALTLSPLSDRLAVVSGGGANFVVLAADDGLLLVDGGAASDVRAVRKLLGERYPRRPVKVLLNTHWHLAQTGLNAEARKQGAEILAHENTRLWMGTVVNSRWEDTVYPPQPEAARPTKTFYDGVQTLSFGGRTVEYGLLPQAHTDGDIYVRFVDENVVVTGDVFAPGRFPVIDSASNGWLGGMHQGLKSLVALDRDGTRYVPSVGASGVVADVKAQQELCYTVIQRIGDSYYKGETWEQLLASAPTKEFDAARGDPSLFLRQSYESAWYHVTEIRRVAR